MDNYHLEQFLNCNFSRQCVRDSYCFRCQLSFCSHCCTSHRRHHPPHVRLHSIARVRSIGGHLMIDAEDSKGVGYDWRRIQSRYFHGHHWMYLEPPHVPLPYPDYQYSCMHCGEKRRAKFDYCSIRCQAEHVPGGNGIAVADTLLAANWGQQLSCDRYCTRCNRAFSSVCCDTHLEMHHANQAAATIQIFHHQGWCLVAANQNLLPAAIFEGVQVINVNGVAMHPIRSRPLQQQAPVAHGMHPCAGPCLEVIPDGAQFCSLRCHRDAV